MGASGLFVTFEGGEGSGKSTQSELLKERLDALGRKVVLLREPGGTALGEDIRELVLHRRSGLASETETLLFLAARADLTSSVIRPALDEGSVVVCDRFGDSTVVYQGYGRGLELSSIRSLNRWATGGLVPEVTVLLDVPVEVGRRRKHGDDDTFQREPDSFHQRVREGYRYLAASEPDRWLVIDGTLPPDEIAAFVWERVQAALSED